MSVSKYSKSNSSFPETTANEFHHYKYYSSHQSQTFSNTVPQVQLDKSLCHLQANRTLGQSHTLPFFMLSLPCPSLALLVSVRESEPGGNCKLSATASRNIKLSDAPGWVSTGKIRILVPSYFIPYLDDNYPLNTSTWKFTSVICFHPTYLAFRMFVPLSCFPQSSTLKTLEKCLIYLSSFPFIQKVNKFYGFCIGIISPLSVSPWTKHF